MSEKVIFECCETIRWNVVFHRAWDCYSDYGGVGNLGLYTHSKPWCNCSLKMWMVLSIVQDQKIEFEFGTFSINTYIIWSSKNPKMISSSCV